jgi:hypothetical protein
MRKRLEEFQVRELFHVTHIANLQSIYRQGLLPKNQLSLHSYEDISLLEVQTRRHEVYVKIDPDLDGPESVRPLHDFVPLFIAPRNPMTSVRRSIDRDICFLVVDVQSLCDGQHQIVFADGNMASGRTRQYADFDRLDRIPWDVLRASFWADFEDGRRRRAAEFLVSPSISISAVTRIEVRDADTRSRVLRELGNVIAPSRVSVQSHNFFV